MNRSVFAIAASSFAASLVLTQLASPCRADAATDKTRAEARERFDRGLQLFNEGDNAGALAEFKRAHELVPNKIVVFNIAMVYAAMNRAVEAVDALDHLLADPASLDKDRLARAKATRAEQGRRVAHLKVVTSVPALIQIDGIDAARSPVPEPLRVTSGTHVVTAAAQGHLPTRKEVTVAGETTVEVKLDLVPSESQLAHLTIKTSVPGVEVLVDGQSVGRSPLPASLTLAPGKRVVETRRRGYEPGRQEIALGEGARGALNFDLDEAAVGAPEDFGRLALSVSESEPQITVDGRSRGVYRQGLRLPVGPHVLRVERAGFEPVTRTVEVASGVDTNTRVTLQPTADTRFAHVERTRSRRRWGWSTLAAGVVLAGASSVFTLRSAEDLDSSRKRLSMISASFDPGGRCDPGGAGPHALCKTEYTAAADKVSDDGLRRNLGLAGVAVGTAALAVGAYLLLTGENPDKYDAPESATKGLAWLPTGWVDSGSGGFAVAAAF
jgi:hypothetical protein